LDSSSVVGTVMGLGVPRVVTARLRFRGPRADESVYSDAVARRWDVPLESIDPWVPADADLERITETTALPAPDPHFAMFRPLHERFLALGHARSLTGIGGDDVFLAPDAWASITAAVRFHRWRPAVARARAEGAERLIVPKLRATWRRMPWRPARVPGLVTTSAARRTDLAQAFDAKPQRVTGIRAVDARMDGLTSDRTAQLLAQRAVLDDLTGHRSTHPFLDPDLIRTVLGIAPWLFGDADNRALQRAAFGDRLPDEVLARRSKAEFSELVWPTLLRGEVLAGIRSGPLVSEGWVDPAGFDALVVNARARQADAARPLARCANADRWLRPLR
jgi:hypothetical protein